MELLISAKTSAALAFSIRRNARIISLSSNSARRAAISTVYMTSRILLTALKSLFLKRSVKICLFIAIPTFSYPCFHVTKRVITASSIHCASPAFPFLGSTRRAFFSIGSFFRRLSYRRKKSPAQNRRSYLPQTFLRPSFSITGHNNCIRLCLIGDMTC